MEDQGVAPAVPSPGHRRSAVEPLSGVSSKAGTPNAGSGRWSLDYIEDAATVRRSIHRPDGTLFTDKASNYDPPANGIHLCGQTDDGKQPTTVAVYIMPAGQAWDYWTLAKEVAECGKDEADFIVDLCMDDSIEGDFWSNRQLWPRAIEAWNLCDSGSDRQAKTPQAAEGEASQSGAENTAHRPTSGASHE
jgi:hypothetical protein